MLGIGAVCALVRAERGPSMLDRVVAVDVVVATVLGSVALVSAWTLRSDLVPVLVVLALVGFIGSVTVARFAAADRDEEKRILTREEAKAEREARRRAELEESGTEEGS
ncbi:pH regulation protein F [Serinibacter arcticus]|uniref:PH regulation protein F n=2 Tax=Serinibacter arcticus TaxID=1655435 RepID=A0A2U1ZZT8_9MICO|nr:pH regulation protein F [Serinibacter arcticus]